MTPYSKQDFEALFANTLATSAAKQMLVDMHQRGETPEEIALGATLMRQYALPLPIEEDLRLKIIDNCGTGGDHSGSFNISTTSALLLSATGAYVAKHGNKSITSKSGSADVLQALGFKLDLDPKDQVRLLEETGFGFLYAPHHHKVMKHIMPIRQSIPHHTIFNILGPLSHPAKVQKQIIGVFNQDILHHVAHALNLLGTKHAIVVHGQDGMDEISITTSTHAIELKAGQLKEFEIDPKAHGLDLYPTEAIQGGDPKTNAQITYDILRGKADTAKTQIVLLNGAYALVVEGMARDAQEGLEILTETIESQKAIKHFKTVIETSQKL